MASTALTHLKHLAVHIGPRGSTTPQERQAAEYAKQLFESLGLETHWEEFTSPTTGWRSFSVASVAGLIAVALFWFAGPISALFAGLLMLIITASIFMEMYFRPNLLRALMPKGRSQNVWARIPATAPAAARRVLLVGHIDTHRTPWVFTSPGRLAFFRLMTTLGIAAFVLATILYLLAVFIDLSAVRWSALIFVPIYLIVLALTWQPDTTPYTPGANDNGSGASIVLSLAERLARAPFQQLEVWAMCSGCEEVGSQGVQAFVKRHRAELPGLIGISIDNVGGKGAGVCYTTVEGMVIPYKPSPELIGLADQIKFERPDFNAYSKPYTTLHTDATCLMVNRVPALSFVGLTPAGAIPNWHQVSDTFDRIDPAPIECTEEFVLELLRRLDAGRA
ncbi:MAG TPA: M28 family peptidase [Anaerolineae bacterium]|nr:M28 family peptidase [Anaerolineae bacterium]